MEIYMNYYFSAIGFNNDPFDDTPKCEIANNEYAELIEACCKHSSVLSFINMHDLVFLFEKIEPYRITVDDSIFDHSCDYFIPGKRPPYKMFFRVCPEIREFLLQNAKSVFDWEENRPADPTFYRADGSVFFYCKTHDDKCVLFARDNEDVSNIVSKEGWVLESDLPPFCPKWDSDK